MTEQVAEYGCSGRPEPFGVPDGVTQLTIEAEGASGNARTDRIDGKGAVGRGGRVTGVLAVTPGSLLTITVGCVNGYGYIPGAAGGDSTQGKGGNGGGATAVRDARQPHHVLGMILVAGGGGGAGGDGFFGTQQPGGDGGDAASATGAGAGSAGVGVGAGAGGLAPARQCLVDSDVQGGYGLNEGGGGGGGGGGFWFTEPTFGCCGDGGGGGVNGGGGGEAGAAAGGGGGGRNFAHPTLASGVTPITLAPSQIVIYPLWRLVGCPTPASSSTVPCYDPTTAAAFVPPQ
jgi:hypothetical protein